MDTYTVLKGCYTKHYLDRCCIVEPFLDSYDGQKLPIVNELYCYDDQYGPSYTVCVNQELYFKDEEVALMSNF